MSSGPEQSSGQITSQKGKDDEASRERVTCPRIPGCFHENKYRSLNVGSDLPSRSFCLLPQPEKRIKSGEWQHSFERVLTAHHFIGNPWRILTECHREGETLGKPKSFSWRVQAITYLLI